MINFTKGWPNMYAVDLAVPCTDADIVEGMGISVSAGKWIKGIPKGQVGYVTGPQQFPTALDVKRVQSTTFGNGAYGSNSAGVGEMGPVTRHLSTLGLENMGIVIDQDKNTKAKCRNAELEISTPDSKVKVYVIPTDEELVMTEDAFALMNGTYDVHTNYTYSFQSPDYVNKQRAAGLVKDLQKKPYLADLIAQPKKR